MKLYKNENVYHAAVSRIRFLFSEFPNIVVGFSGGKDSTVILHLSLMVAKELNRLPLKVMFLDQEAEWQGTVDMVKEVMYNPDVQPYWYQMPMVITNNASSTQRYNNCWAENEKEKWVHPQDPISIKVNRFGTDRFHELFGAIFNIEFKDQKTCYLSGVRCEESPKRAMSLTSALTYKDITWGKVLSKKQQHFTFYPIYDWSYTDVWKSIQDNRWSYNAVYDGMYKYGVSIHNMRISNLHHETAINVLTLIQEIEPETWEKVSKRIDGANTVNTLKKSAFECPKDLPPMFESWKEYSMYLVDNLIQEELNRKLVRVRINQNDKYMINQKVTDAFFKKVVDTVLSSDWDLTKLTNFTLSPNFNTVKTFVKGKITDLNIAANRRNNIYGIDL